MDYYIPDSYLAILVTNCSAASLVTTAIMTRVLLNNSDHSIRIVTGINSGLRHKEKELTASQIKLPESVTMHFTCCVLLQTNHHI